MDDCSSQQQMTVRSHTLSMTTMQEDLYYPHPALQNVLWWIMSKAENFLLGSSLRKSALEECMRLIHYEVRVLGHARVVEAEPWNSGSK